MSETVEIASAAHFSVWYVSRKAPSTLVSSGQPMNEFAVWVIAVKDIKWLPLESSSEFQLTLFKIN